MRPNPSIRAAEVGRQSPERFGFEALRELGPVLDPEHDGIDTLHVEGVSMREERRVHSELGAQLAERRGVPVVDRIGMRRLDVSVELAP